MNSTQLAAEAVEEARRRTGIDFDEQEGETLQAIIQGAIEKAMEQTAEHFRQGLYAKLHEVIAKIDEMESRAAQAAEIPSQT